VKTYAAPWGKSLLIISAIITIVCVGVTADLLHKGYRGWKLAIPVAAIGFAALFTIRGYSISADAILVRRLFWNTRLPLAGLQSVESRPNVMRGSIRLFGIGGVFSISGFYRNNVLGTYRAFVTDPKQTVVLKFPKRSVVISPAQPEDFVRELTRTE
jgi:Bacterial PH domain